MGWRARLRALELGKNDWVSVVTTFLLAKFGYPLFFWIGWEAVIYVHVKRNDDYEATRNIYD